MALARITIRQCEAFVAVADTLSFVRAGHRLGLTPSAVSQLVAELEGIVGFRVFDRSTRRVTLSQPGRDFLGPVQSLLRHLQLAESAASDMRHRAAGVVRIGAPQVLAGSVLPAALKAFGAERPRVVVRIRDTPVDAMLERVAAGDLDLALGPDRASDAMIERQPMFDSPWVLWCARSHPLAARRLLRWSDLRSVALVAAGRDHEISVAQMRANVPDGEGIVPVDVVDNVSTALGIAAVGLAATLAPAYVGIVARPLGLVMKRVTDPEAVRQVCLYRSASRSMPPAAQAFADFLADWLRDWPGTAPRRPGH
ncbi:MAG: LysR family transcriptional regulator [Burkholderiales bacterium]|nr:LysR family transcriptional regulator [Burkholderiales bacterium]